MRAGYRSAPTRPIWAGRASRRRGLAQWTGSDWSGSARWQWSGTGGAAGVLAGVGAVGLNHCHRPPPPAASPERLVRNRRRLTIRASLGGGREGRRDSVPWTGAPTEVTQTYASWHCMFKNCTTRYTLPYSKKVRSTQPDSSCLEKSSDCLVGINSLCCSVRGTLLPAVVSGILDARGEIHSGGLASDCSAAVADGCLRHPATPAKPGLMSALPCLSRRTVQHDKGASRTADEQPSRGGRIARRGVRCSGTACAARPGAYGGLHHNLDRMRGPPPWRRLAPCDSSASAGGLKTMWVSE